MRNLWLALALFVGSGSTLFGNGGAWQTGVPATGNASASKNERHTDVTIENETLKIDLHPDYADVTVRYRMHNTGPKVQQDFFFPVERWGKNPDADTDTKSDDINQYRITVDGKELASTNVAGPKEKRNETKEETSETKQESSEAKEEGGETTSGQFWQENISTIKFMEEIGYSLRAKSNARGGNSLPSEVRRKRRISFRRRAHKRRDIRVFAFARSDLERADWQRQGRDQHLAP